MVGSASIIPGGDQSTAPTTEPPEMEAALTCRYVSPFSQTTGDQLRALEGMGLLTEPYRYRWVLLPTYPKLLLALIRIGSTLLIIR